MISTGLHGVTSPLGVRSVTQWLVVGADAVLLVDSGVAGMPAAHLLPELERLGIARETIAEVVISHADVDHYGGNAELRAALPGARLRAHAADRPLIESWEAIARERYGWYRAYGLDYDAEVWGWLRDAAGPDTPLDGEVADGETLDLGGAHVEVLHLPGHSPGHVGLLHHESGTAIVMDAAMRGGFPARDGSLAGPPPYGDVPAYRATLARLRALAPERLATAHFQLIEGAEVGRFLDASVAFVDQVEETLRGALRDEPRTLGELTRACDARVGPFPQVPVELARSVGAHLEALERAGDARRADAPDGLVAWTGG